MKPIAGVGLLLVLLLPVVATAQDKIEPPTFEKRIEPEYPADLRSFVIETAQVEIVIDQQGAPFSLKSMTSLPDNVVRAMSKWRFRPAKKNGTAVGYRLSVVMPIRRPVHKIGQTRSQKLARGKEMTDAFAAAKDLNLTDAVGMEQQLSPRADNVSAHLTLLAFSRAGTDESTKQMRLRQILWLSINHPGHDVLAAPYATLSEPSPAEADGAEAIRKVWQEQVARYAEDPVILDHATNVLRLTNPAMMEQAILPVLDKTDGAALLLGDLYGLAALGATAVDPVTGKVSAVSEKTAVSPFAVHARDDLNNTGDLRVLFPALSTISGAGGSLANAGSVPPGYLELCGKLLMRAREADPDVEEKCAAEPTAGGHVDAAKLTKGETPSYPQEAKLRRITGTIVLQAMIGKDGHVEDPELLSGPLALYGAAREAVLKWRYQPTKLDGVPVAVRTTVEVNFNLN